MQTKRCIIIITTILLVVLSTVRVETQSVYRYYYPFFVEHHCERPEMGLWSYIAPTGTTNLITNPSLERNLTGWASPWGDTLTRSTTQSKFGVYSLQITGAGAVNAGASFTDLAGLTPGATVTFSAWIYNPSVGGLNAQSLIVWDGGGFANGVTSDTFAENDTWTRYSVQKVVPVGGSIRVAVFGSDNAGDLWMDAAQVEVQASETTYCDGDQNGCEWLGAIHGSQSQRSLLSRAGGTVVDFDDLNFDISGFVGAGKSPITLNVDNYAFLPGGELNSQKTNVRSFTLTGWIKGTDIADLHANRQALINAVSINLTPENQPVVLRYAGASVVKEISAYYQAGLQGNITGQFECLEQNFALQFLATSPNFREIGDSSDALDTTDSANFDFIAALLRSTGQWDDVGSTGTGTVRAFAEDDTYIYVGGAFINWDGIANADRIVRYEKATGTWSALGTGMDSNVYALVLSSDGTLYAGGAFTVAGGGAALRVASWNGVAWSALGAGTDDVVWSLAFDSAGILYATGEFLNAGGAGANRIASWNGAAWSTLGVGLNNFGRGVAVGIDDTVYVGGLFTQAGGNVVNYVAQWDGSAWSDLDSGTNNFVFSITVDPTDGTLFIGGRFTTAGGNTVNYIAKWNGTAWSALGSGMDTSDVNGLSIGPDRVLYAVGQFSEAGGIDVTDGLARWNGSTWAHLGLNPPAALVVYTVLASQRTDPIIERQYDIWIGFDSTGAGTYGGSIIVNNEGTQEVYPTLSVSRSGGTGATLQTIRNETLGFELLFDYDLLDGETLTIFLDPAQKDIQSSFFGKRINALLLNSDFGAWRLRPGDNQITCFVDVSGGATVEASIVYQDQYWSMD